MILPVEKEFEKLQQHLDGLLKKVGALSHEQQNFKPSSDSWSILQVFMHLINAESGSVAYMNKKILGVDKTATSGFGSAFRTFILKTALRLPFKFKAPGVVNKKMDDIYSFEDLTEEWQSVREDMKKFLDQVDPKSSKKLLFKHPFAGRMNIYQALAFMLEHFQRHTKQIERIMSHPNFPKKN